MPGRAATLPAALLVAACAAPPLPRAPAEPERPPPVPSITRSPPRFFLESPEQSFWVSRSPDLDRVIAGGARLELRPGGEVTAAAWDDALAGAGDALVGGLAVPPRLGGGFVLFSPTRVFRARELTGPLEPVATGMTGEVLVRGARAGLSSVVVVTDAGPRRLFPGTARLQPMDEPAVADLAATSARRAVRLDAFGRLLVTGDGGARWAPPSPSAGSGVRQLLVGEADVWVDTWQGRFRVADDGQLEPGDPGTRSLGAQAPLQMVWKGVRTGAQEAWAWRLQQSSPLAATIADGAAVGDGTAFGAVEDAVLRVDLATGKLVSAAVDWIPNGLSCQPIHAADAVLFACTGTHGGSVLRSVNGAPPELEKSFSDDGSFVADDDGALGFVGSCQVSERSFEPGDPRREPAASLTPVLCVRRGQGAWVERRVDVGDGATLAAWVPRLDGTAVALAVATDPLPPALGTRRVVEQAGVRLVRVYPEIPGYVVRPVVRTDQDGLTGHVDRRFQVRADGSVDGWLQPADDSRDGDVMSVTFGADGVPVAHAPAPGAVETVTGGSFAVAIGRDGTLAESTDHGRTWRSVGRSPAPPGPARGLGCSALGCTLAPLVRVGWGDDALTVSAGAGPLPPPDSAAPVRLACAPEGAPRPIVAPAPPPGARRVLSTGWGDTLELVHDGGTSPREVTPGRAGGRPRAPVTPAVRRTQTLVVRAPFSPFAAPRRLDATDAGAERRDRGHVVPLLAPSGEVSLLMTGSEGSELLVAGDTITTLPAFEGRRYGGRGSGAGQGGLALPDGRALVVGEVLRRFALQDHGRGPLRPPLYLGPDDPSRHRPRALARRSDGALGVLVLDGGAAPTAGVAPLDRLSATLGPTERLAPWSTVLTGDDPRCKSDDPGDWHAVLVVDSSTWLLLDPTALPGVTLAHQGLLLVRWGRDRVCMDGLDAAVTVQRRDVSSRSWNVVARWSGDRGRDRGAALRAIDLRQDLACRIVP